MTDPSERQVLTVFPYNCVPVDTISTKDKRQIILFIEYLQINNADAKFNHLRQVKRPNSVKKSIKHV